MKLAKPLLYTLLAAVAAALIATGILLGAVWPFVVLAQLASAGVGMAAAVTRKTWSRAALYAGYGIAAVGVVLGALDGVVGVVTCLVGGAGAALIAKTATDYFAPVSFPLGAALLGRLAKAGSVLPESESVLGLRVLSTRDLRVFLVGEIDGSSDSRRAEKFTAAAKRGIELLGRQGMSVSALGVASSGARREDGAVTVCEAGEIDAVLRSGEVSVSDELLREMGVGRAAQRAYRKTAKNQGNSRKVVHNGRVTKSAKTSGTGQEQ